MLMDGDEQSVELVSDVDPELFTIHLEGTRVLNLFLIACASGAVDDPEKRKGLIRYGQNVMVAYEKWKELR